MGVFVQMVIVLCALAAWVAFIYLYETRQMKRERREAGVSDQIPANQDRLLHE